MMKPVWFVLVPMVAACSQPAGRVPADAAPGATAPVVGAASAPEGGAVSLPTHAGAWTRPDAPKRVTAQTIFDYMDGGGELYVGFRFDHLDVYEYRATDGSLGTILAELYWMATPDDAFGLLSTDWTGEPVALGPEPAPVPRVTAVPPYRALYGSGLLRFWAGTLYARVLASRETPSAREAVLAIGQAAASGPRTVPPALLSALPGTSAVGGPATSLSGQALRADRTCYFRSYLVLNAQYFLASQDILHLGPDVEAVTGEYAPSRPGARPTRVILVRYGSPATASAALQAFRQAYLPEAAARRAGAAGGTVEVEHGFVGWSVKGASLALVLDAGDAAVARSLAERTAAAADRPAVPSR
jgi:hypothetical protein